MERFSFWLNFMRKSILGGLLTSISTWTSNTTIDHIPEVFLGSFRRISPAQPTRCEKSATIGIIRSSSELWFRRESCWRIFPALAENIGRFGTRRMQTWQPVFKGGFSTSLKTFHIQWHSIRQSMPKLVFGTPQVGRYKCANSNSMNTIISAQIEGIPVLSVFLVLTSSNSSTWSVTFYALW